MEYVSPIDERAAESAALADRPNELAGQKIALLDISKRRGDEFLDRIDELLSAHGAKTLRYRKPTFARPAPQELIEEIALHGDLVVEGLAD